MKWKRSTSRESGNSVAEPVGTSKSPEPKKGWWRNHYHHYHHHHHRTNRFGDASTNGGSTYTGNTNHSSTDWYDSGNESLDATKHRCASIESLLSLDQSLVTVDDQSRMRLIPKVCLDRSFETPITPLRSNSNSNFDKNNRDNDNDKIPTEVIEIVRSSNEDDKDDSNPTDHNSSTTIAGVLENDSRSNESDEDVGLDLSKHEDTIGEYDDRNACDSKQEIESTRNEASTVEDSSGVPSSSSSEGSSSNDSTKAEAATVGSISSRDSPVQPSEPPPKKMPPKKIPQGSVLPGILKKQQQQHPVLANEDEDPATIHNSSSSYSWSLNNSSTSIPFGIHPISLNDDDHDHDLITDRNSSSCSWSLNDSSASVVRFGTVEVHGHSQELAPASVPLRGPPIGLGWERTTYQKFSSVDDHQNEDDDDATDQGGRRPLREIHQPASQRVNALLKLGYTQREIRTATRETGILRTKRLRSARFSSRRKLLRKVFSFGKSMRSKNGGSGRIDETQRTNVVSL